jgi:F-type H+-transporting ATPase subunit epsilon
MQVHIVSQEKELYQGEAKMVFAPAEMGEVGILPGHSPFVSTLKSGQITIRTEDGAEEAVYVSGGFIEVQPGVVTILSDTAVRSEDEDNARILEAQQHAEDALAKAKTDIDIAKAEADLANITVKIELLSKLKDKLKKQGL